MVSNLTGKVALIVGGTRGIGAAISRRMVADGASVAMIHRSRSDEADRLATELRAAGADTLTIAADVSDADALGEAIDAVIAHFGRIDILVNNAGLAITGSLEDYPPDAFDRVFAVNVRASFLAAQKAARVAAGAPDVCSPGTGRRLGYVRTPPKPYQIPNKALSLFAYFSTQNP